MLRLIKIALLYIDLHHHKTQAAIYKRDMAREAYALARHVQRVRHIEVELIRLRALERGARHYEKV